MNGESSFPQAYDADGRTRKDTRPPRSLPQCEGDRRWHVRCPEPHPQPYPQPDLQPQVMWPNLCRLIRPPVVLPFLPGRGPAASGICLSGPPAWFASRWAAPGVGSRPHANVPTLAMSADPVPTLDPGRSSTAPSKRPPPDGALANLADSKQKRLSEEDRRSRVAESGGEDAGNHTEQTTTDRYDPVAAAGAVRQKLRQSRRWCPTDCGRLDQSGARTRERGDLEFTLMSYNLLAQTLLEDNLYLYQHCPEQLLDWPLRRDNLLAELRQADADIMCLQELQEDHYEQVFEPEFKRLGYGCLYKRRTGNKRDGCGVFFRQSLFELDRHELVEFARTGVTVLDRDNVAIVALLKPRAADGRFSPDFRLCVSTTHLLFNPRRGDVKLAQLCLLLAEIDRLAARGGAGADGAPHYFPVVLCGDMNSRPHSPLYRFVTRGRLNYAGLLSGDVSGQSEGANRGKLIPLDECLFQLNISEGSRYHDATPPRKTTNSDAVTEDAASKAVEGSGCVSHGFDFVSAYQHAKQGGVPEVTTHHQRASCTVDYIFYTVKRRSSGKDSGVAEERPRVVEGPLRLLSTYGLMSSKELAAVRGLPNEVQSSDHLPLVARFLLRVPS
ncbi:unnamed protein product [Ixodes pacificus]